MARWTPRATDPIGQNETIGRRIYDRNSLKGARDQIRPQNTFELYHFEERREPGDVSVDRLGQTSVDPRVRGYLAPRAIAAAAGLTPVAPFRGWAVVRAKHIQRPTQGPPLRLTPSPIVPIDGDAMSGNDYHADISRHNDYGYYEMAMHLKNIFESNFYFVDASQAADPTMSRSRSRHQRVTTSVRAWPRRIWLRLFRSDR